MIIRDKVAELNRRFEAVGIDSARTDARMLVAFALKQEPIYIRMYPEREIEADILTVIDGFAERRIKREPVSKIIGTKGFWRLDFRVTADVLDPRPDSETLIEEVLRYYPNKMLPLKIVDLGTGTGCLAQALLCEYINAVAIGVDVSEKALEVAAGNAQTNGLHDRFKTKLADWNIEGWANDLGGPFDVVISNPPYITEAERNELEPEVIGYDPALALFGGSEGIDPYYKISDALSVLLKEKGLAVLEFGQGQENKVKEILCKNDVVFQSFGVDFGGITRCISIIRQHS